MKIIANVLKRLEESATDPKTLLKTLFPGCKVKEIDEYFWISIKGAPGNHLRDLKTKGWKEKDAKGVNTIILVKGSDRLELNYDEDRSGEYTLVTINK